MQKWRYMFTHLNWQLTNKIVDIQTVHDIDAIEYDIMYNEYPPTINGKIYDFLCQ